MTDRPSPVYEFGGFVLDPTRRILLHDSHPVPLPPKVLETLLILVENRERILAKDELLDQIWGGVIVEEGGLARNISILRKVLGERPDDHRYIVTFPGRGYQFVAAAQNRWTDDQNLQGLEAIASGVPAVPGGPVSHGVPGTNRPKRFGFAWAAMLAGLILAGAVILQWRLAERSPRSVAPSKIVRLTSTSGINAHPALTPDGTFLAYASDQGGRQNLDIWVQAVGGGEAIQRTSESADETEPSFAPDGSQIVFSRRDAGIFVMGTLSGKPRLVAAVPWGRTPRLSPDGKWIVFWTGFPPSVVAGGIPEAVGSIHVVPSSGGESRVIETPLASERYPIWSPDGEYLLFLGEEDPDRKTHDWYVIPKDGGDPIKTGAIEALRAEGLGAGIPIPGGWRSQDNAVVLATNERESSDIWQIPISPQTGRLAGRPKRLTFGTAIERNPAISDSGRIAFVSAVESVDVWRAALDANTGKVIGEMERVTESTASDVLRNVSDDGKWLTFLSSRSGRSEAWIKNIETGEYRQLTHAGAEDASARPDGRRVAYARSHAGAQYIEILDTASELPSLFCEDCKGPSDWSFDGNRLLFGRGLPARILIHDFRSGQQQVLIKHVRWGLYMARFSPDGRWVAYHATPSPNVRQVYAVRVSLDGLPRPREEWVPVALDHGCHPNWSPDGTLVYYFSFRDGNFCLYAQRVDPASMRSVGSFREVQHFHHPRLRAATGVAAYNDVHSEYIYVSLTETLGNIWMLEGES